MLKVGRYELHEPVSAIVARTEGGYDVHLQSGLVLIFSEEEKRELDQARELHEATLQMMAMCKGAGLRA